MKAKSIFSILLFATVMALPISANGNWIAEGVYVGGGVDKLEFFIVNDIGSENADFEAPGADNFSLAGWSATVINSNYTLATGPESSSLLYFDWLFTGTAANQAFDVDTLHYLENELLATIRGRWDGSRFDFMAATPPVEYDRTPAPAVPEPSTFLLLGAGLAGVGLLRRRFKK